MSSPLPPFAGGSEASSALTAQEQAMQKYLIRRIILVIPTLWLVISILFLVLNALPW